SSGHCFALELRHLGRAGNWHALCSLESRMAGPRNPRLKQMERCRTHHVRFVPSRPQSNVYFALQTIRQTPINGIKAPPQRDSSGWYSWCGEEFPASPECCIALQTTHLADCCPEAVEFLGLPPGYRFRAAGEQIEVWLDPKFRGSAGN